MSSVTVANNDLKINHDAAKLLREIADLLQQQNASPYRVNAYLHAAATLDNLHESISHIVERKGFDGLLELPNVGEGIGRSIYEYVATERMTRLEGLRGGSDPESLFRTIPGVGPRLAERIHHELHIDTLEALEQAMHNGKLAALPGIGSRKLEALQASLEKILGKPKKRALVSAIQPDIAVLLAVDMEYREAAAADKLPKITPKRFNPKKEAWLPIMHSHKAHWHFTAIFSNTARAHDLHKTDDWVVIFFYDDQHNEGQNTVVTETHGSLLGKRVVRGREKECHDYYRV